jgi:hypothetical protein
MRYQRTERFKADCPDRRGAGLRAAAVRRVDVNCVLYKAYTASYDNAGADTIQ